MRKLAPATVLALSLAAAHGLPTPRGSAIAKNEDVDEPHFLRGGISKDVDEAVNSGRKPLMGSITPPGFVGGTLGTRTIYFNYVDDFKCNDDKSQFGTGDAIKNNWVCCEPGMGQLCDYRAGEVKKCYYDKNKGRGVVEFDDYTAPLPSSLTLNGCMADDFKYGLKHSSEGPTQFWGTQHVHEEAPSPGELYFSFRISKIFIRKGTSKLTLENVHFGMGYHDYLKVVPQHCHDWWIGAKKAYRGRSLQEKNCWNDYHLYFCQSHDGTGENGISDLRLSFHSGAAGSYCYNVNVNYVNWCDEAQELIEGMTVPSDQGVCS